MKLSFFSSKSKIFKKLIYIIFLGFPLFASAARLDVLVLHHPSSASVPLVVQSWKSTVNGVFVNSQVDMELNIVGTLAYTNLSGVDAAARLNNLRNDPWVQQQRNNLKADIVAFVGTPDEIPGVCGIGYVTLSSEWAYNLVRLECGPLTFAHEIGHNMGLHHSYVQNGAGIAHRYGRGHGVNGSFTTLMAYPSAYNVTGDRRMPMFSNPNTVCRDGHPCGIPEGAVNDADAARAINNQKNLITNYRVSTDNVTSIHFSGNNHPIPFNVSAGSSITFTYDLPYWDNVAKIEVNRMNTNGTSTLIKVDYAYHDGYSYLFSSPGIYSVSILLCDDQHFGYLCGIGFIGGASIHVN